MNMNRVEFIMEDEHQAVYEFTYVFTCFISTWFHVITHRLVMVATKEKERKERKENHNTQSCDGQPAD